MYLLTELILFFPIFLYACIRVCRLIPGLYLKIVFILFCVLLVMGYPIAESLSHGNVTGWVRIPLLLGYYCLPYLLYFVLLAVAVDCVIFLARIVKLLNAGIISRAGFKFALLTFHLAVPALIVFAGVLNNDCLRVNEYAVEIPKRSSSLNELKIVFASDFHLGEVTSDGLVNRFVDRVNALSPDIILIGGDVLEGHGTGNTTDYEKQFRGLKAKYGVYAVPGNHERHGSSPEDFFTKSGMVLLEDRVEKISDAFYLVGRGRGRFSRRMPIEDLLKNAVGDLPVIVLDHSPSDIENVSRYRVDLQLSGHTHNGQLFPVNLVVMPFQYELAWGSMMKGNTCFIVSSGVQAWGPPVKTAGYSEIVLVTASFNSDRTVHEK